MRSVRIFAFATLACGVMLAVLVSSQHRLRLIIGSFQAIDSNADLTSSEPLQFMTVVGSDDPPSFDSVIRELTVFERTHPLHDGDALPALDDPDTCERLLREGKAIHCYNADIAVCSMLAREHVASRLWDVTGPKRLGGNGHNILEIFDSRSRSWKALDPYYHCYFTLRTDTVHPIDVPKFRLAVLHDPSMIRLVKYAPVPGNRPDSIVVEEFRELAPCAMLHSNNDFRTRYAGRYGLLMPFASAIDKFPLRISRGVRTAMLGSEDRRYVIEDSHSPHYHFAMMWWSFRIFALLFGTFFILTIIMWINGRKKSDGPAR